MERLKNIRISPDATVEQAMRKIDEAGSKLVFAVDEENRLLGVLSDGDIRRWILAGHDIRSQVRDAMNPNPKSVRMQHSDDEVESLMLDNVFECVPVVDDAGRIVRTVWWTDLFEAAHAPKKVLGNPVVIMAGGEGSRLGPLTKVLPKPLISLGDKPIIEHIMDRFCEYGICAFYLTVKHKSSLIKAYFSDIERDCEITYVDEDTPLGTAGALGLLREEFDGPFFLTNCDILVKTDYSDLLDFHVGEKNVLTVVASMRRLVYPYGVIHLGTDGELARIDEKPSTSHLVSVGFYVLDPSVTEHVEPNERLGMNVLIERLVSAGQRVGVYPISEQAWNDIGQLEELRESLGTLGIL